MAVCGRKRSEWDGAGRAETTVRRSAPMRRGTIRQESRSFQAPASASPSLRGGTMQPGGSQRRDGSAVSSPSRGERLLLVLTPVVAMAAVAVGLRLGAHGGRGRRSCTGRRPRGPGGSPGRSSSSTRIKAPENRWPGSTSSSSRTRAARRRNGAGSPTPTASRRRSWTCGTQPARRRSSTCGRGRRRARGSIGASRARARGRRRATRRDRNRHGTTRRRRRLTRGWLRFARREGAIALDVAALGQRVAPGFPAELWVHATDATARGPVGGVAVTLDDDTSLGVATPAALPWRGAPTRGAGSGSSRSPSAWR